MKTFKNPILTKPEAEQALDTAIALVRRNLPLYTDHCQNHSSVHDIYPQCENNQWTCGFWPGEVWLSYERTGDEAFKNTALTLVDSFLYRIEHKIEVDHHDMGFLYSPSCVAAYKLTGSEKGRRAAILAADQLCTRFQEKGEFFQAWGALGAADNYRYIIDCLLNVPLLYWASETTGDAHYADLAHKHVTTCLANSIRPDGSTYHTFFMDPVTGGPVRGATCQGYKDDSCWARGRVGRLRHGHQLPLHQTPRVSGRLPPRAGLLSGAPARGPGPVLGYDLHQRHRGATRLLLRVHRGLRPAGGRQVRRHRRSCRVHEAGRRMLGSVAAHYAVKEGPQGIGLVRHGTYSKEPLQHLHARGR